MKEKLVIFTAKNHADAIRYYADPSAGPFAEDQANRNVRRSLVEMTAALVVVVEHPKDDDCARFLTALGVALQAAKING